jgi:hypothetical protein
MTIPRCGTLMLLAFLLTLAPCISSRGDTVDYAYSFFDDDSGGAAVVRVDTVSGKILGTEPLFDVAECRKPDKIRRTPDHKNLVMTNIAEDNPQLYLWSADTPDEPYGLRLPSLPDEVRITDRLALVTLETDSVAAIDIDDLEIVTLRQLDTLLTPPANAPEDLTVDPSERVAVVSFQKDHKTGAKKGNRLVLFSLPQLEVMADLPLPRERSDLHIEGNMKEQGPGPEVLGISTDTDTLTVTLDLYGALGMLSWSAAQAGRVEGWTMVSTAASPKIDGQTFPDRAMALELYGRHLYMVCNAGTQGGSVLVDLQRKKVVWRRPTPPGLETPVFIPELRQVFTVCSGKTKKRSGNDVSRTYKPRQDLLVFDFRTSEAVRTAPVTTVPLSGFTTQIALVSQQPPLLLIALGEEPEQANQLLTFDPVKSEIKDRRPALGTIGRFE